MKKQEGRVLWSMFYWNHIKKKSISHISWRYFMCKFNMNPLLVKLLRDLCTSVYKTHYRTTMNKFIKTAWAPVDITNHTSACSGLLWSYQSLLIFQVTYLLIFPIYLSLLQEFNSWADLADKSACLFGEYGSSSNFADFVQAILPLTAGIFAWVILSELDSPWFSFTQQLGITSVKY